MKNIISGIYCAFWKEVDNKFYIGQSVDIDKRIYDHTWLLISKRHKNYRLQESYDLYGLPEFHVLEECGCTELKQREIFWIKEFNSFSEGFNLTNGGDGGGFGEGNTAAIYSKEVYLNILDKIVNSKMMLTDIAEKLNVSLYVVKHISSLSAHTWLAEEDPINYAKLIELQGVRNNSAKFRGIVYPQIRSPEGSIYSVDNIHAFCRDHGLQAQNLHKVLTGQRKHHKGWVLECK